MKLDGLTDIEKSGRADPVTVIVMLTVWETLMDEALPVTVTT